MIEVTVTSHNAAVTKLGQYNKLPHLPECCLLPLNSLYLFASCHFVALLIWCTWLQFYVSKETHLITVANLLTIIARDGRKQDHILAREHMKEAD